MSWLSGLGSVLNKGITIGPMRLTIGDGVTALGGMLGGPIGGAVAGGLVGAAQSAASPGGFSWGATLESGGLGLLGGGAGSLVTGGLKKQGLKAMFKGGLGGLVKNGWKPVGKALIGAGNKNLKQKLATGLGADLFSHWTATPEAIDLPKRQIGMDARQGLGNRMAPQQPSVDLSSAGTQAA